MFVGGAIKRILLQLREQLLVVGPKEPYGIAQCHCGRATGSATLVAHHLCASTCARRFKIYYQRGSIATYYASQIIYNDLGLQRTCSSYVKSCFATSSSIQGESLGNWAKSARGSATSIGCEIKGPPRHDNAPMHTGLHIPTKSRTQSWVH